MNKRVNKDVWVSLVTFALGIFTLIYALKLPKAQSFVQSAGFLPFCLSIALLVLSIILLLSSLRKSEAIKEKTEETTEDVKKMNFKEFIHTDKFMVIFNMIIVALLVFVGVPYLGFFISCAIFMLFILLTRVKSMKWYWSIVTTAVTMAAIWAIFIKLFGLAIK